ncbi:phosphoglycerate dehydrogenase [Canibacter sp. lx-72]|uniref:phosphoglycerate dehydrogenase n=1 Tax=Canibacter zhuwentaonis TaxID=2837491 RepID=UPI001BDBB5AC|nr:phosphoglycerate dehydrogenase [Canibacter zhuwentaonis]MBT1035116.1 phosphoglycerate dehydrogenase [Canibacter zhuwentaonis]
MHKILLAEKLSPATVAAFGEGFNIVNIDGTDRDALRGAIADTDAVIVRSATQIDAEALSWASKLKVIARAGVGLDNVDVAAATQAGVMVVNAPTSNVISAAELTVAHILSLARKLPQAHASLAAGKWQRAAFTGIELYEKTVGIIGLGRIGGLVAERLKGFGVELIAYDPYVSAARAQQLGAQLVSLDELVRRADFVTIHMPRTSETVGMIGVKQLAAMQSSAYVVNVARGGLIDEAALFEALEAGQIAGAALDVFTAEPPVDNKLVGHPLVHLTPHLGASTAEAQEKAGVSVARSVRRALAGELVPDAVNVAGGVIDPYVRPGLPLTEKLGQVFAAIADAPVVSLEVEVRGELATYEVEVLRLAALKGVLAGIVSEPVSYVNAPLLAQQRGIEVRFEKTSESDSYRNAIILRGATSDAEQIEVAGTLTGAKQIEKLIGINGYELELPLSAHLLVMWYQDRPGVVASYGTILGEAGVNIIGMQISRNAKRNHALSVLALDSAVAPGQVAQVREVIAADLVKAVNVTED